MRPISGLLRKWKGSLQIKGHFYPACPSQAYPSICSHKWTALLMTALTKPCLNSHKNSVFSHSHKQPFSSKVATDTFEVNDLSLSFITKLPKADNTKENPITVALIFL